MKPRHIAVFTGLGKGHVYPALGLCAELVKRGHRVTWATNELFADRIQQAGAEPLIFKPAEYPAIKEFRAALREVPALDPRWWTILASGFFPWHLKDATVTLAQVKDFYERSAPDLILYDRYALGGRILARRLNIPAIQLGFSFAPYKKYMYRPGGICMNPEPLLEFGRTLDTFLAAHGIEETDNLCHVEKFNIYFHPTWFQHHAEWFDNRFCFVEAGVNRPYPPMWKNNSEGKPIILISMVAVSDDGGYFAPFIDALVGSEYHVILSIGDYVSESTLRSLPGNVEVNQRADHLEILPSAALLICQGGMSTTLDAVYHGVPVIAIPPNPGYEEIAYRTAELGLGLNLPEETITRDTIRANIETILGDTSLLDRVKKMQRMFRRSGGGELAADKVEQFLQTE